MTSKIKYLRSFQQRLALSLTAGAAVVSITSQFLLHGRMGMFFKQVAG